MLDAQLLHRRASRVLPKQLHTIALVSDTEVGELPTAVRFLLRRVPVGALHFRLAPETVAALSEAPMEYLKEATMAREGLGRRQRPFRYVPWKAVAASRDRGFVTCTIDDRAILWLIVGQRLAVYGWNDFGLYAGWEADPWQF